MLMKLKQTLLIALFGTVSIGSPAQRHVPLTSAERIFEEGKQLFVQKNYPAAARLLQEYVKQKGLPYETTSEADYMLACSAYELKDKACVSILQHYLKAYPESPYKNSVNALIGNAYFYEGKYAESIEQFERCDLDALPDEERDECTLHQAIACIETGNLQKAYVLLSVVEACSTEYREEAGYYKAYIDYAEKRYNQALPIFESLRHSKQFGPKVPLYIADIYLAQGRYADAQKKITESMTANALSSSNENAEKLRVLGSAFYGQGQYEQAIPPLERYISECDAIRRKTDKGSPERNLSGETPNRETIYHATDRNALYRLGMSYYHTRAYLRAAEALEKVTFEQDALSQNAYLHLGLCYIQLQNKPQARMAFEQASTLKGDAAVTEQALYNYALCIHETSYSPFAESVTVFERFLNEFPQSAYTEKVNDYLVEVYMDTRSYKAALQSIAKISHPGSRILEAKQKILFRLGTQAFANADFKQAVEYLNQSLALGSYNRQTKTDAYYWRGEAEYRTGQYAAAAQDFKQYIALTANPSNESYGLALYNLGYTAFKQKNYAEAGNWFRQFIDRPHTTDIAMKADAYNRLGDCRFYARNFDEARRLYDRATELNPSSGDYALYQIAFVKGLQKDYGGKIASLNQLIGQFPSSPYIDDALYERGRAYVQLENNEQAIASFRTLVEQFPESSIARKGAGEIGLLYYQDDNYPEAIAAYKQVIGNYPGSDEALQAQRDLKSIYIDLNNVDEYATFVASQKGGVALANDERDSLTYVAAERVYMRGEIANARNSFTHYLQLFSNGAFRLNAHYYLGLIAYNEKNNAEAQQHLDKVIEFPNNKFSEEAMVMGGELAFNAKEYAKALSIYKLLKEKTASAERRLLAQTGILRSACPLGDTNETILIANEMLTNPKLAPELMNEARYDRAKAALATHPEQALPDLKELAKDTRNLYGAEAKYRLAQYLYDDGQNEQAEKELLEFIDVSTPHAYWLARSFVLLSDVYAKMGRLMEARQYLLSLKQNYQADDDIAGLIETRLQTLNEAKASGNNLK